MNFFLIIIFYASSLLAQEEVLVSLDTLKKIINGPKSQKVNTCSKDSFLNSSSQIIDLSQKCALDICGKPQNTNSAVLLDFNFDQYVQKKAMIKFNEVEAQIKEMIDYEFKKNKNFLNALNDKFKNDDKLTPDYQTWKEWDYESFTWIFFDQYIEFKSDKTRPFSKRLTYTLDIPEDATDTFKKGIESYAKNKMKEIQTDPVSGIFANFYVSGIPRPRRKSRRD